MEIVGTFSKITLPETIQSKSTGKTYQKVTFVVSLTQAGTQYPQSVAIETLNENVINYLQTIPAGTGILVKCDCEAREFNGRFYNTIKAWNVAPTAAQAQAPAQPAPAPAYPYAANQQPAQPVQAYQPQPQQSEQTNNADNDPLPF